MIHTGVIIHIIIGMVVTAGDIIIPITIGTAVTIGGITIHTIMAMAVVEDIIITGADVTTTIPMVVPAAADTILAIIRIITLDTIMAQELQATPDHPQEVLSNL